MGWTIPTPATTWKAEHWAFHLRRNTSQNLASCGDGLHGQKAKVSKHEFGQTSATSQDYSVREAGNSFFADGSLYKLLRKFKREPLWHFESTAIGIQNIFSNKFQILILLKKILNCMIDTLNIKSVKIGRASCR